LVYTINPEHKATLNCSIPEIHALVFVAQFVPPNLTHLIPLLLFHLTNPSKEPLPIHTDSHLVIVIQFFIDAQENVLFSTKKKTSMYYIQKCNTDYIHVRNI
jgi:hypothetical protein